MDAGVRLSGTPGSCGRERISVTCAYSASSLSMETSLVQRMKTFAASVSSSGESASTGDSLSVTASDVHVVTGRQREDEIARLLAGSVSETARHDARELLAAASRT